MLQRSKFVLALIWPWRVENSCVKSETIPLPHSWLQYWQEKSKMLAMAECHKNVTNIHWDFYMNLPELGSHPLYPLVTDTQSIRFYWQQHASMEARVLLSWVFAETELYIPVQGKKKKKAEEKEIKCNGKYSGHCFITAVRKIGLLELKLTSLWAWMLGCQVQKG